MDDRHGRPPTIEDVARLAKVSRQTISRVINGKAEVSEATRLRVEAAIRELHYQPNSLARSLAANHSPVIGLVVPDISQPFYPEIARGVEDGADRAGYSVFLCHTAGSPERERRVLTRLQGHRVAGAIICNSRLNDESLLRVASRGIPIVLVNRDVSGVTDTIIWPGYKAGGSLATEHIASQGRQRIAYFGLNYPNDSDALKLQGYREALDKFGIPYDESLVRPVENSFEGGSRAFAALVTAGIEFDGIVASNDLLAIGALRSAAMCGKVIPDDIAVVGFGGSPIAGMVTPGLTTIVVPLYAIGVSAIEEVLSTITGNSEGRRYVEIDPELIIRESSDVSRRTSVVKSGG